MKTRTYVSIFILVFAVLIIAGSCATGKKAYVAQKDEELFGTWINPDYDVTSIDAKITYGPDGVLQVYHSTPTKRVQWRAKYTITDKWIDAKGIIWYKWFVNEIKEGAISTPDTEGYCCLGKISDSGRKLELSGSRYDYPTEVNPDSLKYDYTILYRQE